MWIIPGEPLTAAAIPLWVESGRSPAALSEGEHAPLWQESMRIKRGLRPSSIGHTGDYLDLTRLEMESSIFADTAPFLAGRPGPEELADFQERVADRVLAHLQSIVIEGAEPPPTPLERSGGSALTSYEALRTYARRLADTSPEVDLKTIGASREGRDLLALVFSRGRTPQVRREDVLTTILISSSCRRSTRMDRRQARDATRPTPTSIATTSFSRSRKSRRCTICFSTGCPR